MEHLKYLSWLNYVLGLAELVFSLISLIGVAVTGVMLLSAGREPNSVFQAVAPALLFGTVCFIASMMLLSAGRSVRRGRGLGLQNLLAGLGVFVCCPGLLYTGYVVWVCHKNPSTKQVFEEGGLID